MESQENTAPGNGRDEGQLTDRIAELEKRVERLEREMAAIAKMEGAVKKIFGGGMFGSDKPEEK